MKKQAIAIIVLFTCLFMFSGCGNKVVVNQLDISEEESRIISTLVSIGTIYELYEIKFNFDDYTTLHLTCDFYSYGELIESRSVGGFIENEELGTNKIEFFLGVSTNNEGEMLISFNPGSTKIVDLKAFDEYKSGSGPATVPTVIKNSESEYVLYQYILLDEDQGISPSTSTPFDPNVYSHHPFYFTITATFGN